MFRVEKLGSGNCLISDDIMVHPTSSKRFFAVSIDTATTCVSLWIEREICVEPACVAHSVVLNDEENFVYQKLEFGNSCSLVFETNLDFLQFCEFVGLDFLPKSLDEA